MSNFSFIVLIWELFLDCLFKIDSAIRTVEGNIFMFNKNNEKNPQFLIFENKKIINSGLSRTRR